jgi:glycerophosphoryl diester phosphodiesterase
MFWMTFFSFICIISIYHLVFWKPLNTGPLYKNYPFLKFGHRGSTVSEPENTIPSFLKAIFDGCNAIELDIHMTKDNHLVVIHDDRLERTTDGIGFIENHTLAELKTLNAAKLWENRDEKIPTLKEVFEAIPPNIIVNVEIKNFSFFSEQRIELELVRFIRDNDLRDRVIVSSFNPFNIWRVKMADPQIFTALLWYKSSVFNIKVNFGLHVIHPDILHPYLEELEGPVRFWSRVKKLPMHVWVVNEKEQMLDINKRPGVKGIMTDDTKLLNNTIGAIL